MIAVTNCEEKSQKKFRSKIKPYLNSSSRKCVKLRSVRPEGKSKPTTELGDVDDTPLGDVNYLLNADLMLAVSHAIEDMASEVKDGELLSTFQDLGNFEPQRKRYRELSQNLSSVRVVGCGEPPKRCGKTEFVRFCSDDLARYWVVSLASDCSHAALVCQQVNKTDQFKEKLFVGFYTFNPFFVRSIHRHFSLMMVGLGKVIKNWQIEMNLPVLTQKELKKYLKDSQ
ncbi:MAG: DICT sensory domain-containing protein [Verrucomicrobiota bacterium]